MCRQRQTSATDRVAVSRHRGSPGPGSPAEVRQVVRRALAGRPCALARDDEDAAGDALLVASELVTNAMIHGGGVTGFDVTRTGRAVRLSVSDRSDRLPVCADQLDAVGRMRVGGRGWMIVCTLASDVVISRLGAGGKRITAEVPLSPGPSG
ncbi:MULTISPECIES: ATP-binding protein [unclassified Streptomyces]|uniref:ATP-binding protein n=1 Tax=unclassified Streptomyces TaxID=2593676 RepID=UPI0033A594D4